MFVHPALALGALLAAVPLIIHLLNRRRHLPLEWAAMRFVIAAYRKTRRRAQMENLLLLLLRMAAVALLAFALARPFTGGESPLAAFTESRRDVVLVLDDSASTAYRENVQSVHERIVERAREILLELDGARGDRVHLVRAARYATLLSWRTPEDALQILGGESEPSHEPLDLAALFSEVVEYAEEDAAGAEVSGLNVRILTDLQRRSFDPSLFAPVADEPAPEGDVDEGRPGSIARDLDRLHELGVRVAIEDHGPRTPHPANLSVDDVATLAPVLGPNAPVEVGVTVRNHGDDELRDVRVALEVDGERRPLELVDVPARGRAQAVFSVTFAREGAHELTASLEGDRLAIDDARTHVLVVPPTLRVLLVNGAPAPEIERDGVGMLEAVLAPADDDLGGPASFRPFDTRVVAPESLGAEEVDLASWDVIWLANVRGLSAAVTARLEERVAQGAGLVISLGAEVDATLWNDQLWRADGSGLLPAELLRPVAVSPRDGYFRVRQFAETHPALAFFADERWRPLVTELPVQQFLACRPIASATVLAELDDEGAHPLLVEREYDRGRVVLLTTTIDPSWTRLPISPRTLVPLSHELLRYAGRPAIAPRNASVGSSLVAETDAFPRNLVVVDPAGSRTPLNGEPEELGDGRWVLPPVAAADLAGLWRVEREGEGPILFGVQLDPTESDLARVAPDDLEIHPAITVADASESAASAADNTARRGELWRFFAAAALAALVLESLWAAFLGSRRRAGR